MEYISIGSTLITLNKIYNYIDLFSNKEPDINDIIKELEIRSIITETQIFLQDININKDECETIKTSYISLALSLTDLEKELNNIEYRINWNCQKYFFQRSYRFHNSKGRLQMILSKIENKRKILYYNLSLRPIFNKSKSVGLKECI